MHGTKDTPELPTFGNKGIGVMDGYLEMHGKAKTSWSLLDTTLTTASSQLSLTETVEGWEIGDRIIIASTSFEASEYDIVTIKTIATTNAKSIITFDETLKYGHFAAVESYAFKGAN
jgi:hypothetical protein